MVAAKGDEVSITVQLKGAGSGIGQLSGRKLDAEEPIALDHHVEGVVRRNEVALLEDDLVRHDACPQAELQARWEDRLLS